MKRWIVGTLAALTAEELRKVNEEDDALYVDRSELVDLHAALRFAYEKMLNEAGGDPDGGS